MTYGHNLEAYLRDIAGSPPDHRSKECMAIKQVVIFLFVKGFFFHLQKHVCEVQ